MQEYILDGAKMTDRSAAHTHMAEVFEFPDWYGKNLDALWDLLCEKPVRFVVHIINWSQAEEGLEEYADKLMELFGDLVEEEEEFSFDVAD